MLAERHKLKWRGEFRRWLIEEKTEKEEEEDLRRPPWRYALREKMKMMVSMKGRGQCFRVQEKEKAAEVLACRLALSP